MIDTDKYEGHTLGPWWIENGFIMGNDPDDAVHVFDLVEFLEGNEADAQLATDAPLLLAEVKRLREALQKMLNDFETKKTDMWTMRNRIETILKGDD